MDTREIIGGIVSRHYPDVQAVYLFGSRADGTAREDSDIDIAVLLPESQAEHASNLAISECRHALEDALGIPVDLLNAREVSTVMQFQFIYGERILCCDVYEADVFEMLTMSYYQKLNEERAGILAEFQATGRLYDV